jgi:hypothetical protein
MSFQDKTSSSYIHHFDPQAFSPSISAMGAQHQLFFPGMLEFSDD